VDFDIHQAIFNVDERAIGYGVRVMAATALTALRDGGSELPTPLPGATANRQQLADTLLA